MQTIKIYNKSYTALTTLTSSDFTDLKYKSIFEEIGSCDFTVKLKSAKITAANLEMYNRIEIIDEGEVKFVGVIVNKIVNLDTASIKCRELTYVLKRRILDAAYVANGAIDQEVTDILSEVNTLDDTGISIGDLSTAAGTINATFNRANAFDALKEIIRISGNQFRFETDRTIDVKPTMGEDLSESVIFRYEVDVVAASNIFKFAVEEDGDNIVTKAYGKSDAFTSTQNDAAFQTKYGVLENYKDFRVANTSAVLDDFTTAELVDRIFSPDLQLNPEVEDNFEVGDTVRIIVQNALIDIDDSFQVLEKTVQYTGKQKHISVRINDLPNDYAEKLRDRDRRLELLEKEL